MSNGGSIKSAGTASSPIKSNSTATVTPPSRTSLPAVSNKTTTSNSTHAEPVQQSQPSSVTNSSSTKVPGNSTQASDKSSSGSKSDTGNDSRSSENLEDDSDSHNNTYPLFHYEDIQNAYNYSKDSIQNSNVSEAFLDKVTPMALQKNLSTTKTPFLPWEKEQPDEWPKFVGAIFLCSALILIAATCIRNVRNSKRKNYEEIQSLVV
jgi:hypothetical protein